MTIKQMIDEIDEIVKGVDYSKVRLILIYVRVLAGREPYKGIK